MISISIKIQLTILMLLISVNSKSQSFCVEKRGDRMFFEVLAPSNGWLALGFNQNEENIVGSYLVFGTLKRTNSFVEDHYVVSTGIHKSLFDLGEGADLKDCEFVRQATGCTLRFSLPTVPKSPLAPIFDHEKKTTVWLAFSESMDLDHHSIFRKKKIIHFKTNRTCFHY